MKCHLLIFKPKEHLYEQGSLEVLLSLLNQSAAHDAQGDGDQNHGRYHQITAGDQDLGAGNGAQAEIPRQCYKMRERQEIGHGLRPVRQGLDREEGTAEQIHRRDEQEDRQIEHVDAFHDSGEDHADSAEQESAQECQGQDSQSGGKVNQPEQTQDGCHDAGRQQ
jgi:hypothetical protein